MKTAGRGVVVAAAAVLAVAIAVPVVAIGSPNDSVDRAAMGDGAPAKPKVASSENAAPLFNSQAINPRVARRCSLACTQRVLLKLIRKHNKLVKQFNKLRSSYYRCEKVRNVTQYGGYDYQGQIGAASALDFTLPGDPVSEKVVVWVC